MRIKRREGSDEGWVEVMVEDFLDEGESREHFEERLVRMVGRLTVLNCDEFEQSEDEFDGERN
jgi:hypothetical protein